MVAYWAENNPSGLIRKCNRESKERTLTARVAELEQRVAEHDRRIAALERKDNP
jgi:uncharacterized protein YceH (UPF0502 family)